MSKKKKREKAKVTLPPEELPLVEWAEDARWVLSYDVPKMPSRKGYDSLEKTAELLQTVTLILSSKGQAVANFSMIFGLIALGVSFYAYPALNADKKKPWH